MGFKEANGPEGSVCCGKSAVAIIVMIWWTGLAPWEFELPFTCSLISTFLAPNGPEGAVRCGECWGEGRAEEAGEEEERSKPSVAVGSGFRVQEAGG